MASPSYVSEPQIQRISHLVREIGSGFIQVPRFQRPIVWTDEQRLDLFRSIRDGIPIGSILVWRTSLKGIHTFDQLGPHRLARADSTQAEFVSYLLDGHQRLSTLFGALQPRSKGLAKPSDGNRWEVHYDLDKEDFTFDAPRQGPEGKKLLPLSVILDSRAYLQFQRTLSGLADEDSLILRADELAFAIQEYKLAVIPIVTDDIDVATRTFQRINSEGTPMSQVHMVAALTWQADFDLNERLAAVREEILAPVGWGELEDRWLLSTCKVMLDLDLLEGDADQIAKGIRDEPQVLEEAANNLVRAAEFLREVCHLRAPRLLPYSYIPVFLAEAFHLAPEMAPAKQRELERWFWWVSYVYFPVGVNSSRLRRVLEFVRRFVVGNAEVGELVEPVATLEPFPQRFDFRLARCKLLALLLARTRVQAEGKNEAELLLGTLGHEAMQSIFVRRQLLRDLPRLNSPANRILVSYEDLGDVRILLQMWGGSQTKDLPRYAISMTALERLRIGDPLGFLEQRQTDLEELERRFGQEKGFLR